MGPIEQQFATHAHEVRSRLMNTVSPSKPKEIKTIEIVDEKQHLQARIDSLLDQLKFAKDEIDRLTPDVNSTSIAGIIKMVCEKEEITRRDLVGSRRNKEVCFPRQIACYLSATQTNKALTVIAKSFGDRDHTTILHAKQKIAALRTADKELDEKLKWYESKL
jgi:chromosomal replication initiation ATPase DnaA